MSGQGGSGSIVNDIHVGDIDSCISKCKQYGGCVAIDFAKKTILK